MRNEECEMRNEKEEKWWLWWEKLSFEMRKAGGWDEKNEFEMRKRGLEVSKNDSFGVDGFDSKKHVKVLIFGCLCTRQKL